ncbi:unnamed protein product [Brachionus calyciflorus]|uniref:Uncharacterized protein n=1 Tax=Brachionus calyciflorus TaxID=104777 RepID=A0A814J1U8_9BILA|nr:unnamed protein product [Brachionus calyciflorus]
MRVLVKTEQTKKADPRWNPRQYTVTAMKSTMVTAGREGHVITRNASLFKPYQSLDDTGSPAKTPQAETQAIQLETPPEATQVPAQTSAPTTTTQPAQTIHDQTNKRKFGRPTKSQKKIVQEKAKINPVDSEVQPPRRSERLKGKVLTQS